MKKHNKALSIVLAVVMILTALPPMTLAQAAGATYTVLMQTELKGDLEAATSGNAAILRRYGYYNPETAEWLEEGTDDSIGQSEITYIATYTGSGVELSAPYYHGSSYIGNTGFSKSGYAQVKTEKDGNDLYVDAHGNQLPYDSVPSADGYVTTTSWQWTDSVNLVTITNIKDGTTSQFTYDGEVGTYENGLIDAWKWIKNENGTSVKRCEYLDKSGNVAISGDFDDATSFSNGYAWVSTVGDSAYDRQLINTNGEIVYKGTFMSVEPVSEDGIFRASKDRENYIYLDIQGNEIFSYKGRFNGRDFQNGYAVVKNEDGKYGLIDTTGQVVIPFTYIELTDVSDTGILWARSGWNNTKTVLRVDPNPNPDPNVNPNDTPTDTDYIYDTTVSGEDIMWRVEVLEDVKDKSSAVSAVETQISGMTEEQKASPFGIDVATLYAETAIAKAASKTVTGSDILINAAATADLEQIAKETNTAVESALANGGVTTARSLSNTITFVTKETGKINIQIDPDILTTKVDKIRVETPTYAITLKTADLAADLTKVLTVTAQDISQESNSQSNAGTLALASTTMQPLAVSGDKVMVRIEMPNGKTTNPITISLPYGEGDTTYQAIVNSEGNTVSSKFNPATTTMDGKVTTSGSYTVTVNEKDFTDIANKSVEMQIAIRYLASKGIINGTTATEFSPDASISRAEIATLLVRALGKLDTSAQADFTDVTPSDWYYAAAGSSQRHGLIKGFEDATFRGTQAIVKEQIVAVLARVLTNEMNYKEPSDPNSYLSHYSDNVATWAQSEVALATRENLVLQRVDGTFSGAKEMTRGDAAIMIYRLFQRIW